MALKGNLRDFSVTQLLNLIHVAHKTGTLVVEGADGKVFVAFKEGRLAYAQRGQEDNSLVTILHRSNKLNTNQHRTIKERAGNMGDKELGLLLINAKIISQQDIISCLQLHFINQLNRLFTWGDGSFHFENNLLPPDDKITVRINLENIILEGSRRMRELEQLQDEIPSLDIALKFAERPGTNLRNVNLNVEEWRVVSFINPKNTIRQIALTTKKNDLEMRRIVYGLLQAGLVEFTRPTGKPITASLPRLPTSRTTREEQKSLINRIISRIRSI
jgi:hypothetical protein